MNTFQFNLYIIYLPLTFIINKGNMYLTFDMLCGKLKHFPGWENYFNLHFSTTNSGQSTVTKYSFLGKKIMLK